MKNKLFKIGKPVLSLAVAFAVVAASLFVVIPGIGLNASAATVTDTWDGTKASAFESGTGTESDPYMIATAEQLAYAVLGDKSVSEDKYFKVVDDAVFNMNGMQDITLDSTVGDVKLATATGVGTWTTDAQTFAGNFDGNGVVIYNLYSVGGYAGLFPYITTDNTAKTCSFKNITVANSYISGYHFSGGIIGNSYAKGTSQYMNVENCMVKNCYISDNGNTNTNCNRTSGTMVGCAAHNKTTIKNCFALDNITSATNITGGFIGNTSAFAGDAVISSCISIGTLPYSVASSDSSKALETKSTAPGCYSNVYTDQDADAAYASVITKVSADNMVGAAAKANMPSLDWTQFIAFDGEYPDFRSNHTLTVTSNGDTGHSTICIDCGKSLVETHNLVEDMSTLTKNCACGYSTAIVEFKDTWDGTLATSFASGSGTKNDPYIIATAEQMAYVALGKNLDSNGKYFKVIDNAVFNMNGLSGIDMDSTAEEVRNAPVNKHWTAGDSATFKGHLDGNGVIIYNVYTKGGYAGLFPHISTNNDEKYVSIKNITVLSSRFNGYHYSGGIVGLVEASKTDQSISIENCAVKNCYISDNGDTNPACNRTTGSIIGSVAHNKAIINNCLSVNNLIIGTDINGGFVGNSSAYAGYAEIKNSVSIGNSAYSTLSSTTTGDNKVVQAQVSDAGCFTNVYTDQSVSSDYSDIITFLETAQLSGVAAAQNLDLDFVNIWFANNGTVELQISHNLDGSANPDDNYAGHTSYCTDCGITGAVITNHIYNTDYTCTICAFTCDHQNKDYTTVSEDKVGDCVTAPNTKTECACGYVEHDEHGKANGHKLVKTDAVANTCAADGNIEYWTCENCGNIFLTDDTMAPMNTAVDGEEVIILATGSHVPLKDSGGNIVYAMDGNKHWKVCETCNCELEKALHTVQYDIDGANGHSGKCSICLYEVSEKSVHEFGDDAECDTCEWVCLHDAQDYIKVDAAEPDCENDGCIDHYRCNVCRMVFEDSEAKVPISTDAVIIEKLGHEYTDLNSNGKPVYDYNETAHWYNCETCGKGSYAEHTIEVDEESYEGIYKWCEDADGYGCDYSTFDYAVQNEDKSVVVTATTNAFTKDVITDIFDIGKKDFYYEKIEGIFKSAGHSNFTAYEISPSEEVAEGGKATVTIEVPNIFGQRAVIYLVDIETGKLEKLDTTISTVTELDEKNKEVEVIVATVETDRLGIMAVASSDVVADDTGVDNNGSINNNISGNVNGDNSLTSPPTGESATIAFVIVVLASVTVLFVRKAKI